MNKKVIYSIAAALFLIAALVGFNYYLKIFGTAITKDTQVFIGSKDNLLTVEKLLTKHVKNIDDFSFVANLKKFTKPKGGMYQLKEGMSMNDVVNLLRSGNQTPIKISFNNQDTLEKLAARISDQIEADSIALINAFTDKDFLSKNNLTPESALQIFIPNSYELYWNTSVEKFRDKMLKEYHRFWNSTRKEKAKKQNLSITQVIALASIVQKETAKREERPIVAGLYLNRIKRGIPLQADPTIIYVLKQKHGQDFVVKRVLKKDLEIQSPYNTYLNRGIPPSLIAMPDISSIDAVLNPAKHNYLYMCVNVDKLGYHAFASSLSQHNRNAAKYHRWLSKQGINR